MTRMMIDMPDDLEAKLRARAMQGGFPTAQDYVRALIIADAGQAAAFAGPPHLEFDSKSGLQKLVQEGIDSGGSSEITAAEWAERRRSLTDRHAKPASA